MMDNYRKIFVVAYDHNNSLKLALRAYEKSGELHFLVVDPHTLQTSCSAAQNLNYRKPDSLSNALSRYVHIDELQQTPYYKALQRYNVDSVTVENHGLQRAVDAVEGSFLTIDLCPSNNIFEQRLFDKLIELSYKNKTPTPVAVCVSGLWIATHQQEFAWLRYQHDHDNLDITWVNHSLTHPYYCGLNYADNFLNFRDDNFDREILDTEKMLLAKGIMPSIFFRFPGLVSNNHTISKLKEYGLIPLGSSAWLSKGEAIFDGSIILIHANGNEVDGVVTSFIETMTDSNFLPISKALV